MKRIIPILRLVAILFLFNVCYTTSQAQFTLSAEVRPRSELRNGFKTPTSKGKDPAFFTEQRSRLYFDFAEDKYKFRIAMQDVRMWGENSQIFKEEDGNSYLSEAWAQYFVTNTFSIKAGRQIISYDNQRFLGGLEWAQQGRRHDALLLVFDKKETKTKFHLGLAYNSDDDVPEPGYIQNVGASFYSVGGSYKTLQYGWFNKKFDKGSLSLLALNAGLQQADSTLSYKQTFGVIPTYDVGGVVLSGDFYYQTGKVGARKVNALLAGVKATMKTDITPITIGVEYISGKDDDDDTSDITNFSPDFGTNHAHNGFMDYFFVGPANGSVGVTDIYLKTKFKLPKGHLAANIHEFMTGSKQFDEKGDELNSMMGTEVDLVYSLPLGKGASFNLGFSQMFATNTMLELRNADVKSNNWAWMMITFKPTLLKTEKKDNK